ncbi:SirB2 family protein [Pelagibaculum spongiae]|uniref:SirB2 family protein n=1 Tax=Pelagibaculum spongiae TaxID=2080658 RepID=UPI001F4E899A|nr:SirB2 family protein [Pelagibaculum spongiae]
MLYLTLKQLHIAFAVTSIGLFALRWLVSLSVRRWLQHPFFRVLPHLIDTLLLAFAIALCLILQQYPIAQDWLTAKVVALVVYVLLGYVAIKGGKNFTQRFIAGIASLVVAGYIVGVAIYHNPWSWAVNYLN